MVVAEQSIVNSIWSGGFHAGVLGVMFETSELWINIMRRIMLRTGMKIRELCVDSFRETKPS